MPREKKQEETFTEILLESNLEEVAQSLIDKIMEPLHEYVRTGDSGALVARSGTISPDVEFDLEECLGEYRMQKSYMVSNNKSGLRSASAHAMTLQVLDPSSSAAKNTDVEFELAMLEKETLDLLEHEMGHYYLQKMHNAGSCIYYTDPRGYAAYFEDPQEISLHSKVIWNELKRSGRLAERYRAMLEEDGEDADRRFIESVRRTVEGRVPRLEWQVGVPGARFPKKLQKRYVDIIMKYYVEPFMEKIRKEKGASSSTWFERGMRKEAFLAMAAKADPCNNPGIYKGERFFCGAMDPLDGYIEEIHTWEEARDADFHHSFYFSEHIVEAIDDEELIFFWIDRVTGELGLWWRSDNREYERMVMDQIRIDVVPPGECGGEG